MSLMVDPRSGGPIKRVSLNRRRAVAAIAFRWRQVANPAARPDFDHDRARRSSPTPPPRSRCRLVSAMACTSNERGQRMTARLARGAAREFRRAPSNLTGCAFRNASRRSVGLARSVATTLSARRFLQHGFPARVPRRPGTRSASNLLILMQGLFKQFLFRNQTGPPVTFGLRRQGGPAREQIISRSSGLRSPGLCVAQ